MYMQERRLALGCCLHARLGAHALQIVDTDVSSLIGQEVLGQSLVSRAEAERQLIADQRSRMLCGEAILYGTVVRFEGHGDGVYVGDAHARRHHHEGYPFSFGAGADGGSVELMYPALMEPVQWSVQPPRASEPEPGGTAE